MREDLKSEVGYRNASRQKQVIRGTLDGRTKLTVEVAMPKNGASLSRFCCEIEQGNEEEV